MEQTSVYNTGLTFNVTVGLAGSQACSGTLLLLFLLRFCINQKLILDVLICILSAMLFSTPFSPLKYPPTVRHLLALIYR